MDESVTHQRRTLLRACAALPLLAAAGARAQGGLFKAPIRVVVPFAPGGALDTVARTVQPVASRLVEQSLVIENRPGAFNILGTEAVAKSNPDGETLLFAAAPQAFNTALGLKLPYDPLRDFEYVSLVARIPGLFIVHPSLPVHTLKDLVAWGKAQPGGIQFASAGVGSMPHLLGEWFFRHAGVKAQHVGYKGSAPALQDLIGGQVKVLIDVFVPSGPQILSGRARGLAVASDRRSPLLPDVPTAAESGYPGFEAYGFYGVVAPARTPKPIIQKLNEAFVTAANDRSAHASLIASGYEVVASSPSEYRRFVQQQIAQWTPVVKQAHISVQQ
jgi:tripartite-type tricarboxylate transporter receptor subunit TctC